MKKKTLLILGLVTAFVLSGIGGYSYFKIKNNKINSTQESNQKTRQVASATVTATTTATTEKSTPVATISKTVAEKKVSSANASANNNENENKNLSHKSSVHTNTQSNTTKISESELDKIVGPYFFKISNDMNAENFADAVKTCDELIPITDKYNITKKYYVYQRKADAQRNLDAKNMLKKAEQMYKNNDLSAATNEIQKIKDLGLLYPSLRSHLEDLSEKINTSNQAAYFASIEKKPTSYEQALEMLKKSLGKKANQYTYKLGAVDTNSDGSKAYMIEANDKNDPFGEVYQVKGPYDILTTG